MHSYNTNLLTYGQARVAYDKFIQQLRAKRARKCWDERIPDRFDRFIYSRLSTELWAVVCQRLRIYKPSKKILKFYIMLNNKTSHVAMNCWNAFRECFVFLVAIRWSRHIANEDGTILLQ